jgi:CelD/BcsL family acetyltransferase involved in cellulose biosynthesis
MRESAGSPAAPEGASRLLEGSGPSLRGTVVDPTRSALWRRLIGEHRSDVFHSPAWLGAVAATYRFEPRAAVVMDGETPVAGLPYVILDDARGRRAKAFPFSDYCDPIAANPHEWGLITEGVAHDEAPLTVRCLHSALPLADARFRRVGRARWHEIDVAGGAEDIWTRLLPAARQAIRRSERHGVTVRHAQSPEELRAFYLLHLQLRKQKRRMLSQPYPFFENIWEAFIEKDRGTLLLASIGDRLAGGVLFLEWQDTLYYKFNASDPELLTARPNDAIMWAGIEFALKRGLRAIDLGLSDWGQEGLLRYKRKYATREKTITSMHTGDEPASPPGPTLTDQLSNLTDLLTDPAVPDDITEQAGALLYRFFA